ncbi:MAG: acyl-[acyl-carrier-protein] thioesterase [Bilifractor sp.]
MKYFYTGRVRFSEVDDKLSMTPYTLLNYFQDTATFHGEDVGLGIAHNREQNVAWMIADMQAHIFRFPRFNEEIRVGTWSHGFHKIVASRDFSVEDHDGEALAIATSDWVLMNMVSGTPEIIPQEQIDGYGPNPDWKFTENLGKRKIHMPNTGEEKKRIVIREEHLDINGHMNNAQYIRLSRRFLPDDFTVHYLRVNWVRQVKLGDTIVPVAAFEDGRYYVEFLDLQGERYFISEFQ